MTVLQLIIKTDNFVVVVIHICKTPSDFWFFAFYFDLNKFPTNIFSFAVDQTFKSKNFYIVIFEHTYFQSSKIKMLLINIENVQIHCGFVHSLIHSRFVFVFFVSHFCLRFAHFSSLIR